jgi:hypothetical protein
MRAERNVWRYRSGLEISSDLTGFSVEAIDGGIGTVVECSTEVAGTYLVVNRSSDAFDQKVMLPGGLIERIDYASETVFLNRTTLEIKSAPDFVAETYRHESYRTKLGRHYGNLQRPIRTSRER